MGQLKWTWYFRYRPLDHLSKFDLASRGPWGALKLLWTLRGRDMVATIGAVVTVAALTLDPVAQLLPHYYNCDVPVANTPAVIPRKNSFSEMGLHAGAGFSTLTNGMQYAINAGLFNPESVNLAYTCPTGNCTFDDRYHTVAYCSRCTDRSKDLTTSCHSALLNVSGSRLETQVCNSSLPSGFAAISGDLPPAYRRTTTYFTMRAGPKAPYAIEIIAANLTKVYQGRCTTAAENATWACRGFGAASCELYPCVRSYTASVQHNTLKESFQSSSDNWAPLNVPNRGGLVTATLDVRCLSTENRQVLGRSGYAINDSTEWLPFYGFGNGTHATYGSSSDPLTIPDGCLYEVYTPTINSIQFYMNSFLNGSVTADPNTYDYVTTGPVQLNKIFDAGNVSYSTVNATFADIADSMTAYIRQSAKPGNTGIDDLLKSQKPATGLVFRTDTCVSVRWWYLALPITLVALTITFLITMIIQTEAQKKGLDWKSSPLALLFHGLDARVMQGQGELQRSGEMDRAASRIHVHLAQTNDGYKFTDAD